MRNALIPLIVSALIVSGLLWIIMDRPQTPEAPAVLHVFCAAGIKAPVAQIAQAYEEEYGVKVQLQYDGSGTLLSHLAISQQGDLYIAADSSYTDIARDKGLVRETIPLSLLRPVIAVPIGNPKNIHSVQDLLGEDIRLSLANPDAAAVGKTTKKLLSQQGHWKSIEAATQSRGVFKPTVPAVANDVKLGTVDAAIVWDVTVNQYPEIEAVAIAGADAFEKHVTIGVLSASQHPAQALRFARYLSAPTKGGQRFEENGFPSVVGDAWSPTPEILYYSGGVNRIAIEKTLNEFQLREGITIDTIYNGCGILLGQIKGGGQPDLYHTCDVSFMEGVESQFTAAKEISKTDIVMIVQKGNPKGIKTLADLSTPSLQVGACNEEQSTLGTMTALLLRQEGLYESVQKNVVVNTPTADLVVMQLRVGQLDAGIVYKANCAHLQDYLDIIPLNIDGAFATQTIAVARQTRYPQLLQRLEATLQSAQSKDLFLKSGFDWISTTSTP